MRDDMEVLLPGARGLVRQLWIAIMPCDLPVEEHVFHLRPLSYIVDYLVWAARLAFGIDHDADVVHPAAQVPGNQVSRGILLSVAAAGQLDPVTLEEHPEDRHTAVIDTGIGKPAMTMRICGKVAKHVLVNFFLQVNTNGAVGADHFVGADPGIGGNVTTRIRNSRPAGNVAHRVMSALHGGGDQFHGKCLLGGIVRSGALRERQRGSEVKDKGTCDVSWMKHSHRELHELDTA